MESPLGQNESQTTPEDMPPSDPSFNGLSNEMINEICKLSCPHCSIYCERDSLLANFPKTERIPNEMYWKSCRKDLLNLCLVSKRVRDWAQPVLFHHFGLLEKDPDCRALLKFYRSIWENRSLGGHVRLLRVTDPDTDPEEDVWTPREQQAMLWKIPSWQSTHPVTLPDAVLYELARTENKIAMILPTLTVMLTPKIRELDVVSLHVASIFSYLELDAAPGEHFLPELRFLSLGRVDAQLDFFHYAPIRLRTHLNGFMQHFRRLSRLSLTQVLNLSRAIPMTLNLKMISVLDLKQMVVSKSVLKKIVQATGGLERFQYCEPRPRQVESADELDRRIENSEGNHATVKDIFEILASKKNTLKEVKVHTWYRDELLTSLSLSSFTNLESLSLNDAAFFDLQGDGEFDDDILCNLLPRSLSVLDLSSTYYGMELFEKPLVRFCGGRPGEHPDPAALSLKDLYLTQVSSLCYDQRDYLIRSTMGESYRLDIIREAFELDCRAWWQGGQRNLHLHCIDNGRVFQAWED